MLEKIEAIVRNYKGDDSIKLAPETTFEELDIDSLASVELVMDIEDAFGISIEISDPVKTIDDLLKIIEKAQQEG